MNRTPKGKKKKTRYMTMHGRLAQSGYLYLLTLSDSEEQVSILNKNEKFKAACVSG